MCAKPRHPHVRSVKTPESLAALRAWIGTFDSAIRHQGTTGYETGQVTALRGNADHYVEADVLDEDKLSVTLFLTRGKWTSRCTCDRAMNCSHVYAASLAWLAAAPAAFADDDGARAERGARGGSGSRNHLKRTGVDRDAAGIGAEA